MATTGSCHCGAVRFELAYPPEAVTDCNCSVCRRLGTLWAYYKVSEVTLTGETQRYVRGDRTLASHHCPTCGCATHWSSLAPSQDRMAINGRLLDTTVLSHALIRRLDGADTWTYLNEPAPES